ncbi:aminotransferase class V-fold PLP-dependent enzyme [Massilia sp. TS11]|uniref:aminotransferase class V-fold PLP-dependent enzyme n=1 Tax=Massilia sp. TS11 TaxID=2908003 RepID=UPI001EDA8DED|nr:aminotransferase class V-fold PLP-dependent enzyme [Massilia sp. TS11]MCG2584815.1 aminotransferase class V-fold PLP-dependent enzyme [Massilia sp. TS11]
MYTDLYLDANATSSVLPAACEAARQAMLDCYGNPSSTHATGLQARALLDATRACAQRVLGAGEGQVVFTSGATESIGAAVLSALVAVRERRARGEASGKLLVYGATEHKAVPETLAHWNRLLGLDLELVALPVDAQGRHRLEILRALAPDAALVCTMAANNETGVVSDLDGIEAVLQSSGSSAYWMVDSVQALGKLDLRLASRRIDYAPFSGHKLYAPKGIGMLYVRAGAPFTPLTAGGGQEGAMRAGTENMPGIAALGAVLAALEAGDTFRSHAQMEAMRARLAEALRAAFPGIVFNMPFAGSLPTTLNFSVPGVSSQELLNMFDAAGVRVSSGSACSSAKAAPSYVLAAMDRPDWCASAAVRMSFGPLADAAFIDEAVARIARCGAALRASGLVPGAAPVRSCDGVLQLRQDQQVSWLLLDAASGSAVAIDTQAALAARMENLIRAHGCQLRAVLDTGAIAASGSAALAAAFGIAPGWPQDAASVTLGDGSRAAALQLGARQLARLSSAGGDSYLLGSPDLQAAHVSHAFTGAAALPGQLNAEACCASAVARLARLVHRDTVLCRAEDPAHELCSSPAAEYARGGALAPLLAAEPSLVRAPAAASNDAQALSPAELAAFLAAHPQAQLIDVREVFEQAASAAAPAAVRSVPLTELTAHAPQWLQDSAAPLVFFCRSGVRGARAAACLQRLGHPQVWYVAGPADAVLAAA